MLSCIQDWRVKRFSKPCNMRSQETITTWLLTVRKVFLRDVRFGCRGIRITLILQSRADGRVMIGRDVSTLCASCLKECSMQFNQGISPCPSMKFINVLSDDCKLLSLGGKSLFSISQSVMSCIWMFGQDQFSSIRVKFPNKRRVGGKCRRSCQVLSPILPPKTSWSSEGGYSWLGWYSCPCQGNHMLGFGQYFSKLGDIRWRTTSGHV